MTTTTLLIVILLGTGLAYWCGLARSHAVAKPAGGIRYLASLPSYYASLTSLWALMPSLLMVFLWVTLDGSIINALVQAEFPAEAKTLDAASIGLIMNQLQNIAAGVGQIEALGTEYEPALAALQRLTQISQTAMPILVLSVLVLGALLGLRAVRADHNARLPVESIFNAVLFAASLIAILTTFGIVFSVLFESIQFFQKVPFFDFLLGTHWSPQIALRADQQGATGSFGAIPLIAGTLLISFIALCIAVPIGLMSAIYLAEYASRRVRSVVKPSLEVLAGIPTVVYGFFAALTVAPAIRGAGDSLREWGSEQGILWLANLSVSSESALAAGVVMGVMIIPFVSSLSDDVITAVPQSLRDGSYGLGATQSETIKKVIFPAALPGIVGGVLLATSRAIGETMIVVMAAGLAANLTINPLEAVTTVTVQIVTLLVGDQEFDSAKTLAAFALGLFLFVITLALNVIALRVVKKYREQYD